MQSFGICGGYHDLPNQTIATIVGQRAQRDEASQLPGFDPHSLGSAERLTRSDRLTTRDPVWSAKRTSNSKHEQVAAGSHNEIIVDNSSAKRRPGWNRPGRTLIVVLENLLSGLVGAVLGFVGAFLLDHRRTQADDRAAVRAVMIELGANGIAMEAMAKTGLYVPSASSATWAGARLSLARRLTAVEFIDVGTYYSLVDALLAAGFAMGGPASKSVQEAAGRALAKSNEVFPILERHAYDDKDRAVIAEALTKRGIRGRE